MFWFDNSRKNLVSYARSFNQKERDQVEKIFAKIIRNEHGTNVFEIKVDIQSKLKVLSYSSVNSV